MRSARLALAGLLAAVIAPAAAAQHLSSPTWDIGHGEEGIHRLTHRGDPFGANLLRGTLQLDVRFQINDGDWHPIFPSRRLTTAENTLRYTDFESGMPFAATQTFTLEGDVLEWDIELESRARFPVTIGDLAIALPWRTPAGSDPVAIFEQGFTKHHFIAGDGSFLLFTRASGDPPFLLLTVKPGTRLEYFTSDGTYKAYVHSGYSGNAETRGSWRQPHTSARLAPQGSEGDRLAYGFRLQWARSYDEARELLYRHRLLDIRVVPGMTLPEDLEARFSLRTAAPIDSVVPEFPAQTELEYLGEPEPDHHLYRVRFRRLGENLLTVHFDGDRKTYLEFFSTEPVETLLRKRSAFIVERQQHRDPSKWYDGLFSIYDMKNGVLRGPDDTDGYEHWWGYVLASDDPALGKAPYVASLNSLFPRREEIEALEYHLERFVWGGLQRTDREEPHPYGIYGVPNWKVARSDSLRAQIENRRLDRMKVWRAYDYPHLFMLYYHMYQIAERYPEMVRYLDADGYFERMWQTTRAFLTVPYAVNPWYDIYKWGYYNELLIPDIIALLEERGRQEDADWLRGEWEKKVKYFVYGEKYPFRSEYAYDRTAYESTYALAKYAAAADMRPDTSAWWDRNLQKWHTHPEVSREAAREFMERQHRAHLSNRGWLEAKYYLLGSDFTTSSDRHTLSYMARMGGWSILDYALRFADEPSDWLQLGYASYLSSFALMNTGRPETDYGYWAPGAENDGALGWAFMSLKHGRAWIRKDEDRGAWRYDGEADLGMGAVVRTAATVLADDPLFGWFAYGGQLEESSAGFRVWPRDGVRIRFWLVDDERRVGLELDRDGWSAGTPIEVDADRRRIRLVLENRTGTAHTTRLSLDLPPGEQWRLTMDGAVLQPERRGDRLIFPLRITDPEHRLVLDRI